MIENRLRKLLAEHLPGIPVLLEYPREEAPAQLVLLEKTGSSEENRLPSATFAIQSYGPSMQEACQLNEQVKQAMRELESEPDLASVRLNSDYNFTDTSTKRYRYQAVYEIKYYEGKE